MGFEKAAEEDDLVLEEKVKILVDSYSQDHLKGANVAIFDGFCSKSESYISCSTCRTPVICETLYGKRQVR